MNLIALLVAAAAVQQSAAPTAVKASTERVEGQGLAESLVAAINGTTDDRTRWLREHMDSSAQSKANDLAALLERIAVDSGGLNIVRQRRSGRILMSYVTTNSGRSSRLDLVIDKVSNKPLAINGFPWPRPYSGPQIGRTTDELLARAIEERVSFAAKHDDFSGVVLATKGDEVLVGKAYGLADAAQRVPNTLGTRLNLGSMDKMFTAVAIAQLIEQGKVTLDTPVIEILPDYPNKEAGQKITLRHLLTHSSGLGALFDRSKFDPKQPYSTVAELLPVFASEPLAFTPGSEARYSNEGFVLLGAIIEKLSGLTYYDYVQHNVFARAGMEETGYPTFEQLSATGIATGYKFPQDDPIGARSRVSNRDFLGYRGNSAGGGYSTVSDVMRFLRSLKAGRLASIALVQQLTDLNEGGEEDYGLGFEHVVIGDRSARGHTGGGPRSGINSDAKLIWETDYGYVILGNYDAPFTQIIGSDIAKMLAAQ